MSRPPRLLHRLVPSWSLTLTVLAFWLMLADSFTVGQFLFGALLGVIIPLFAARIDREFARIGKLRVIPGLVLAVLWDILLSNLRVAAQVLGKEERLHSGFIWMPLEIHNIHGIAALTSMITLTPGTVSVALSDDRRHLLIHVLHIEDEAQLVAEIKSRYEKRLMELFP